MADDDHVHGRTEGGDLIASAPLSPPPEPKPPVLDPGLADSAARTHQISATLTSFEAEGCPVTDHLLGCQVTISPKKSDGVPHQVLIDAVADFADVHLRFEREQASFELSASAGGVLDFISGSAGDPSSVFEGEELTRADRAWKGNVDAARSLYGEWSGDLTVYLAAPLQQQESGTRVWRAVRSIEVIVQELAKYPWWRTGELIYENNRPVVIVVIDETEVDVQTPTFAVVSLSRLAGSGPAPEGMGQRRALVQASSAAQLPAGLPLPEELEPEQSGTGAPALAASLRQRAEACAWAWLSNASTVSADSTHVTFEYFGYRQRLFKLGPAGYTAAASQQAFGMYIWATAEPSPDRILAIRQVVSLYERTDLPDRPQDIVRAAEPLYQALRARAVAAVLDSQRQARTIAVDAARKSADAAQSAAKSAAERTIASLAAVVAVAVARATAVLAAADARAIAIGIAALFVFLAIWAIAIEGLDMRAPLNSFKADLPTIGHLLSEEDRNAILDMQALKVASHSVLRVRIAAPCVYIAGAAITLAVAYYKFGLRL
jgi:hypothetical protein